MTNPQASCSFCQKSYRDVGPLVEGPSDAHICGDCVELCKSIIKQEHRRRDLANAPSGFIDTESLQARLDELVGGESPATRVLAQVASQHYGSIEKGHHADEEDRKQILLIGPSPSSMIFLCRALAHVREVPFVDSGLESLVNGKNDGGLPLLYKLVAVSEFDLQHAQRGIVYVDGTDQHETQHALLRLWGENIHGLGGDIALDIRNILFVCGGSFAGREVYVTQLGFHPEQPVTGEMINAQGMLPEMRGHFGAIAKVAPLEEKALKRVLGLVYFERAQKEKV